MAPIFHKHPRLRDRDYTRGAYFVTIAATRRGNIFGRIIGTGTDARMELNDAGLLALDRWNAIPEHHPGTRLDQTQIMPDHLHAIIVLDPPTGMAPVVSTQGVDATGATNAVGGRPKGPAPGSLGAIIGAFKSESTKRINRLNGITGKRLWLAGYYERSIRRQGGEHGRIAQYIAENPAKWW
jgi:REP element-mobilizing transposase RayT